MGNRRRWFASADPSGLDSTVTLPTELHERSSKNLDAVGRIVLPMICSASTACLESGGSICSKHLPDFQ